MDKILRSFSAAFVVMVIVASSVAANDSAYCDAADAALHWIDGYAIQQSGFKQLSSRPTLIIDTCSGGNTTRLPRPRNEKRSAWRKLEPVEDAPPLSACELSYSEDKEVDFIAPRSGDPRFDDPLKSRYGWRSIDGLMKDQNGTMALRVMSWRPGIGTIYATIQYNPRGDEGGLEVLEVTQVLAK